MNADQPLPKLRAVDVFPFRGDGGEVYLALRDSSRLAERQLAVSPPGYFILAHFDGRHTIGDVQAAFLRQFGQRIATQQIAKLVHQLDQALLLQNERFERAYQARCDEYLASKARDNRDRWPSAPELRAELESLLSQDGQPPRAAAAIRGIIAPHLDYARGAPCYAAAYRALADAPPADRYVILGTNHFGRSCAVVATRKDFHTPLGRVATDRGFIDRIEARLGASICDHEFDHVPEHSVELQVHLLQVLRGARSFTIVPVLCPDPAGPTGTRPRDGRGPDLGDFADALRDLLLDEDVPTQLIAGADLSHVGQRFGDDQPTTPEFLKRVGDSDRRLLKLLERRKEEEFVERVRRTENATRICSVGCIYTLLRALLGHACRVLAYHQAVDMSSETHVTCAAAVIE
ncbi:MAG: AmmeMemoRadiSam system protein B [Phycisphaerae bacterium]|jgi:hypothetical protein